MLRKWLPHAAILLSNMYLVFFVLDRVNRAMAFINNGITKGLLVLLSLISIFNACLLIHDRRERIRTAQRRADAARRAPAAPRTSPAPSSPVRPTGARPLRTPQPPRPRAPYEASSPVRRTAPSDPARRSPSVRG